MFITHSSVLLLSSVNHYFYDIALNPLSSRLLLSISFSSFSEVLSCSFDWNIFLCLLVLTDFLFVSMLQETGVRSLGWEDPLEEGMATHSGILAWRIPWTEEPGGLQSIGSQRVEHEWVTNTHAHSYISSLASSRRNGLIKRCPVGLKSAVLPGHQSQVPAPPADTSKLICGSPSFMVCTLLNLMLLHWFGWSVNLCMSPLRTGFLFSAVL